MIENILAEFNTRGIFFYAESYGNGIINDTFLVEFNNNGFNEKYILRKINKFVFKDPETVINNTVKTIEHIANKLCLENIEEIKKHVLQFIKTKNSDYYIVDKDNNYWCVLIFIENTYTIETVKTREQAYQAAKTFGKFQKYLLDANLNDYKPTIKNFHNLQNRLILFEKAIRNNFDSRVAKVQQEINTINSYQNLLTEFLQLTKDNKIPTRITHNDAKINNVLMNKNTNKGQCVIDLDTVMPGKIMYDFGDMVRTFTNSVREDYLDLSKVSMRIQIFESLAEGYLEELAGELSKIEIKTLVYGAILITYEQAIRYLTDYLIGDVYYITYFKNQNLTRTRVQLKLLKSILNQKEEMEKIINKITSVNDK